jgi:hypothetical protein
MFNWQRIRKKRIVGIRKTACSCFFYLTSLPPEWNSKQELYCLLISEDSVNSDMQENEGVQLAPSSCFKLSFCNSAGEKLTFEMDLESLRGSFLQNLELHFGISNRVKFHLRHGVDSDFVTVTVDAPAGSHVRAHCEEKILGPFFESPFPNWLQRDALFEQFRECSEESTSVSDCRSREESTSVSVCRSREEWNFFEFSEQNNRIMSSNSLGEGITCIQNDRVAEYSMGERVTLRIPIGPRSPIGILGETGATGIQGQTGPAGLPSILNENNSITEVQKELEQRLEKMEEQQENFFQQMQQEIEDATALIRYNPYIAGAEVNRLTAEMMQRENSSSSSSSQFQEFDCNSWNYSKRLEARIITLTNLFLRQNPEIADSLWREIINQEENYLGQNMEKSEDSE